MGRRDAAMLAAGWILAATSALAADIVLTPPVSGGVSITNAAGNATRLRVADDGTFTLPTLAAVPGTFTGLCVEIATGKVGTCSLATLASITAGTGLSGGTITTSGTISLAANYQLPQACTNGQLAASNGAGGWTCTTPAASSGGTVTSVGTGPGLTGGPISTSGTISLVATQLLPTIACSTNQVPKWNGSAWACGTDLNSAGTVTGVTASAPLASSGGATPNISLTSGSIGQVLVGTIGAPAWSDSPTLGGNVSLAASSTAGAGNVMKGGSSFLHNAGNSNTFVGVSAGNFTVTGSSNSAAGINALASLTSGTGNSALGAAAGSSITTGNGNTAVGNVALLVNALGGNNTAVGLAALRLAADVSDNTAVGANALGNNSGGGGNTAVGSGAMELNTAASGSTAVGFKALNANLSIDNTAVGNGAMSLSTTGSMNIAVGSGALRNNTASENTAVGFSALILNTTGAGNTAVGSAALLNTTTGGSNTAVGFHSLAANTTGTQNVAVGDSALNSNLGNDNTAVGFHALKLNAIGTFNTALGASALSSATGIFNIGIGAVGGNALTSGNFNIAIGNTGVAAESNTIRVGTSGSQSRAFIAGIRGVTTLNADGIAVLIDSAGQLGTVSSSRRFKDDIADMDEASSALNRLRPVTFHYKADQAASGRRLQYGLIAEEVAEVYPGLVARSADGEVETVMYQFLPAMLLNEYQKQQRTIERQRELIADLQRDREVQKARMDAIERAIGRGERFVRFENNRGQP